MLDCFDEIASEELREEIIADNCPNNIPSSLDIIDDEEEFYVKIPLREYWDLGSELVREKIMASIQYYEWIDDFYFMMDLNEGVVRKENMCLINLHYIEDDVWRKYIENH